MISLIADQLNAPSRNCRRHDACERMEDAEVCAIARRICGGVQAVHEVLREVVGRQNIEELVRVRVARAVAVLLTSAVCSVRVRNG